MNKTEFIAILANRLKTLPQNEINKSISYFSEIIDDCVEEGMSEEEATAGFESIDVIVEKIMLDTSLPVLVKAHAKANGSVTTLTVILLIFGFPIWFPIIISVFATIFSIYISLWAIIISLYATVLALVVSGIVGVVTIPLSFAQGVPHGLLILGSGFACIGVGIILFLGVIALSKLLVKLTIWSIRKIKKLFIRKEGVQ